MSDSTKRPVDRAMDNFVGIVEVGLSRSDTLEKKKRYLNRELYIWTKSVSDLGGILPPRPETKNIEVLKAHIFGLMAQVIALDNRK